MAALRSSTRVVRQFSPTASLQQVRYLSMTGSYAQPSRILSTEPAVLPSTRDLMPSNPEPPVTRYFNTSRALKQIKDSSTIDFAYFPQYTLNVASAAEAIRVPLLPDNFAPPAHHEATLQSELVENVHTQDISTMSGDSHGIVSAMSEVTDNHAIELDPYNLTEKVAIAARKFAAEMKEGVNDGMLRQLWNGVLDDILGARKLSKMGTA